VHEASIFALRGVLGFDARVLTLRRQTSAPDVKG
jgi:hypothetical protein